MKQKMTKNLALSAMLIAVGLILPLFTGQIPQIGNMLLPMHIPVFLCGLICGWKYGLVVGFITPLLRSAVFGVPILFPNAIAMAFELMTYGGVIGLFYEKSRWKCIVSLYRCMIAAMLSGRLVWGIVQICLLGIGKNGFTFQAFMAGAFVNAVPGIILQFIVIPSLMLALNKTGLVSFHRHKHKKEMLWKKQ
ncbi:MAG: ECF transporter S component [Lachnospiraceae bacterium]|nr:ECF transporter S component [Lachnospiraceae bacterium]